MITDNIQISMTHDQTVKKADKRCSDDRRNVPLSEFLALKKLATMTEKRWQVAYDVLVLGNGLQEVANRHKLTRQNVNDAVNTVLKWRTKYREAKAAELDSTKIN